METLKEFEARISAATLPGRLIGTEFERWCKHYLEQSGCFQSVYLWEEYRELQSEYTVLDVKDCGADLVCIDTNNELCAVQCKFRLKTRYLTQADLQSFICFINSYSNIFTATPILMTNVPHIQNQELLQRYITILSRPCFNCFFNIDSNEELLSRPRSEVERKILNSMIKDCINCIKTGSLPAQEMDKYDPIPNLHSFTSSAIYCLFLEYCNKNQLPTYGCTVVYLSRMLHKLGFIASEKSKYIEGTKREKLYYIKFDLQ